MRRRIVLERDVCVVRDTSEGAELRGPARLSPGAPITLVGLRGTDGARTDRAAVMHSWRLHAMGSNGPIYRGLCRWIPPGEHQLPADGEEHARPGDFTSTFRWHHS